MAGAKTRSHVPPGTLTAEQLQSAWRQMLTIRRFEEKGRAALWHGADWRVLPFIYRPGSRGGGRANGAFRR